MTIRFRLLALFLVVALVLPLMLRAQDQSGGTLHVLSPSINADQDTAELCLEFDHTLDRSNPNRILAGIHLESNDKPVPVMLSNVSFGATSLCLESLAYRQSYSLTVTDLRGADGEKLTDAYKFSFPVTDRLPALAFAGDAGIGRLPRLKEGDPILRAVNVTHVKVSLYRLTDPARMADAYRQRLLTTLAPSESLAFAKDNAQSVWQGELVLDDGTDDKAANRNLEHPIPLHGSVGALTPGLYLVVAQDTAPPEKTKDTARLAPIAAQWFIRSDLEIHALRRNDGVSIEAENADESAVTKGARFVLFDHDGKQLAEAASDANGLGFLPLTPDQFAGAATIVGITQTGEVDFADLSLGEKIAPESQFILPDLEASLTSDQPFYSPSTPVYLTLAAHDIRGQAIALSGSSIQLLRPDHSLYMNVPVPDGKAGIFHVSFLAPAVSGLWAGAWQRPDGHMLAQIPLRVTANPDAPRLIAITDHPTIGNDGDVNLSLKGLMASDSPAPYVAGQVFVQWKEPTEFAGWSDYHFGKEEKTDEPPAQIATFITDAKGEARLHFNLKSPDDGAPLHTAIISARSDPAAGALDPDPLELPVRPNNYIIGIKPLAPDGKFAENSLARFDVIVLDGDGKRHEDSDLKYQIYQEGRNFAWYQAEGRWDYKPQQQRRRIGGGPIDIKASGANIIHWPVTAGSYVLEITDANGVVLARLHFNAGWGLLKPEQIRPADLALTSNATFVQSGVAANIKFKLDHPSVISAVIADDRIRKIIHEARPAGENTIALLPTEEWGNRIRVSIEAQQKTGNGMAAYAGQITLPMRHHTNAFAMTADAPTRIGGGQELAFSVAVDGLDRGQPTFVNVLATPVPKDRNLAATPASVLVQNVEIGKNGKAPIHFVVPVFSGILRLVISAANQNQWEQKELSTSVETTFAADLRLPALLEVGDTAHLALALQNNSAPAGAYRYALGAGSGLKPSGSLEGSENFPVKSKKEVTFDLTALETGTHTVKLDLTGPHDFRMNHLWPLTVTADSDVLADITQAQLAPQKNWSSDVKLSGGKAHVKTMGEPALVFIAAQPLFNAPQILPTLIASSPFTTEEITAWLEVMRLWREPIIKAEFLSENALQLYWQDEIGRLLARQKPDGGFPSLPTGDSAIVSTADALVVLAHADEPEARPAADAAAAWLRQRLANTWFEDDERAPRAAAFAALAATDRLDVSSLRYFAETSDGKNLPPLAMAQLAAALAKSNDQDKTTAWLKSAREQLDKTPALWPVMADNPLFDPRDLLPLLEKTASDFIKHPSHDPEKIASFLRTIWIVNNRAGNWRVSVNGGEKSQTGMLVIAPPPKSPALVLHNPMDRPLYLIASGKRKAPAVTAWDAAITRHMYRPDGSEVSPGTLKQGEVYLVTLEGSGLAGGGDTQQFFVHDETGAGLQPLSCMLGNNSDVPGSWGWLKNLSSPDACEVSRGAIDAVLTLPAAAKSWRMAYLLRADYAGTFNLAPATLRSDDRWVTGSLQPVTIK